MKLPSCIFSAKIYTTQVVKNDNLDYRDHYMTAFWEKKTRIYFGKTYFYHKPQRVPKDKTTNKQFTEKKNW